MGATHRRYAARSSGPGHLTRDTPPQVQSSNRQQRRANVHGGFECRETLPVPEVLLIDDVTTTGNTLSACAAALKIAGATSVWALTLAKES